MLMGGVLISPLRIARDLSAFGSPEESMLIPVYCVKPKRA